MTASLESFATENVAKTHWEFSECRQCKVTCLSKVQCCVYLRPWHYLKDHRCCIAVWMSGLLSVTLWHLNGKKQETKVQPNDEAFSPLLFYCGSYRVNLQSYTSPEVNFNVFIHSLKKLWIVFAYAKAIAMMLRCCGLLAECCYVLYKVFRIVLACFYVAVMVFCVVARS